MAAEVVEAEVSEHQYGENLTSAQILELASSSSHSPPSPAVNEEMEEETGEEDLNTMAITHAIQMVGGIQRYTDYKEGVTRITPRVHKISEVSNTVLYQAMGNHPDVGRDQFILFTGCTDMTVDMAMTLTAYRRLHPMYITTTRSYGTMEKYCSLHSLNRLEGTVNMYDPDVLDTLYNCNSGITTVVDVGFWVGHEDAEDIEDITAVEQMKEDREFHDKIRSWIRSVYMSLAGFRYVTDREWPDSEHYVLTDIWIEDAGATIYTYQNIVLCNHDEDIGDAVSRAMEATLKSGHNFCSCQKLGCPTLQSIYIREEAEAIPVKTDESVHIAPDDKG